MERLKPFFPHFLVLLGFIAISLVYFYPVLQGKKLYQSDIAQFVGMAKEQNDFRAATGEEPYWTNTSFGGMPTYQLGANYPHDYIGDLDDLIRFLPRPADYLFLYFIGFYVLLLVMKVDPLKAFLGALAFGFSTYMIIILGAGHNAKAHAIGYMPLVVAGVLLVFKRRYITGGLLTMVAAALEINANHFQMTYYLLLLLFCIGLYYFWLYFKEKAYDAMYKSAGVFVLAAVLALGANATNLMATAEYADFSIRGKSELTFNPDGSPNTTTSSMDYDYITEYSYGKLESLNLIAPRLFGGSDAEPLGTDSHMFDFMISQGISPAQAKDAVSKMPAYWGDQPLVAAPAYVGAIVAFLALLCFFVDRRRIKYAFLAGAVLSLMLSWGKNFDVLTSFFIDYVPIYDKFRAVSSIQVILELCVPVLAIMGLQSYFKADPAAQKRGLLASGGSLIGVLLLLFVFKGSFDFTGTRDAMFMQSYGPDFVDALQADRMTMYSADLLRSAFFIIVAFGFLWFSMRGKLAMQTAVIGIGVFMVADLFFVDKRYVNADDFVPARYVDIPFDASAVDQEILADKDEFRVFEVGAIHNARTSYFHNSLSGYSAVRTRRMEHLLEYQIMKGNLEVLNMLNTRYVIQQDEKGNEFAIPNPEANGNAWFVSDIKAVRSADEEMKALYEFDPKKTAIVNTKEFPLHSNLAFHADDAEIRLMVHDANYAKFATTNASAGLAVFSEIYYPYGWNAYIDGEKTPILRANYVLRALEIPAGEHTVEFKFEPEVVKTGSSIALLSSLVMAGLIGAGFYVNRRRKAENPTA